MKSLGRLSLSSCFNQFYHTAGITLASDQGLLGRDQSTIDFHGMET